MSWLTYAMHELPSGVLSGTNGATADECHRMLLDLDEFEALCRRNAVEDHSDFIEACRWHLEHYAHYLGRRRHFVDYLTYISDRRGPRGVKPPATRWA